MKIEELKKMIREELGEGYDAAQPMYEKQRQVVLKELSKLKNIAKNISDYSNIRRQIDKIEDEIRNDL